MFRVQAAEEVTVSRVRLLNLGCRVDGSLQRTVKLVAFCHCDYGA